MLKLDLPNLGHMNLGGLANGAECAETGAPLFSQEEFVSETKFPLMVRVIPAWIEFAVYSACAIACFGAALTTSVKSEDYGLLIVGIAAVVGAYGSRLIVNVRNQTSVPTWLSFRWKEDAGAPDSLQNRSTKFQAQEMAVDIYRIVQALVGAPLVWFRVYQMAGKTGNLFETKGIVTLVCVCGVLSYFVLRVGVDELAPVRVEWKNAKSGVKLPQDEYNQRREREKRVRWLGVVAILAGVACYTLLLIDVFQACSKSTSASKSGAEFVAYTSTGYIAVIAITIVARQCSPGNHVDKEVADARGDDGYSEDLSVFKDVSNATLGVMIIGFLAFGSAFDVLEQPLLGSDFFR